MFHTIQRQLKIFLLITCYCFNFTIGGPDQLRLLNYLFADNRYQPIARPVQNDSDTLPVTINFALQHIIDFDEKNEAIVINGWMTIKWNDYSLRWKPEEFGNIQTLRIPSTQIWTPDIFLYNSCMTIFGFLLSPDSGEKLTLRELKFDDKKFVFIHSKSSDITTLLTVVMFSLLLSEILPPSSNAIPIITAYFMCIMIMSAVSVVASVLILSVHFRNSKNHTMSLWVRKYICNYLAWLLFMKRPNHDLSWHGIRRRQWTSLKQESNNRNKLFDNHYSKISSEPLLNNTFELLSTNRINVDKRPLKLLDNREKQRSDLLLEFTVPPTRKIYSSHHHQNTSKELYTCDMTMIRSELGVIISQLDILINYSRKKEKDDDKSQDWQFVAMVIDRLCLVIFAIIMLIFTVLTFLSI
ncbi:unnamed protein product [Rotaria sordida]|uniref:Uncharacterized protein n=1 Tax=Rotaria sordida TaxID=392033 RepID=A0A819C4I9_9BILA|nr:unnamed protein product [Rotaria sordida]